jgi:hypothetical protein
LANFISTQNSQNRRIAKIAKKKQMAENAISYKVIGAAIEVNNL